MRIGDTLKKAAGLFVEIPEDPMASAEKPWSVMDATGPEAPLGGATTGPVHAAAPTTPASAPLPYLSSTKTVEQIVREQPGPNLEDIKPSAAPAHPVIDDNGVVSFTTIYQLASLPTSPFPAEQVLELLASLPKELPMETRRATVKVTLSAVAQSTGASPETIVADASRKLAALAAYAKSFSEQADLFTKKSEEEIATLEQEIARRKASIEAAKKKQLVMVQACTTESDRLDDVLEFFSLDVGPSKYAAGATQPGAGGQGTFGA